MSRLSIRAYDDGADRAGVIALWGEAMPPPAPRNAPELVIDKKLAVQPDLFFVAVHDDRVVGTAMAGYDGRRGWVYAVAVKPSQQRRGIGAKLMEHVQRELATRGCVKLNLQVEGRNAGVVAFYESLGFCVEDRISMGRTLS